MSLEKLSQSAGPNAFPPGDLRHGRNPNFYAHPIAPNDDGGQLVLLPEPGNTRRLIPRHEVLSGLAEVEALRTVLAGEGHSDQV